MSHKISHRFTARLGGVMALFMLLTLLLGACNLNANQLAGAAAAPDQVAAALSMLQSESEGAVQVDTYAPTGAARWVSAE